MPSGGIMLLGDEIMKGEKIEMTLPSAEQVLGYGGCEPSEVFKKYGKKAAVTDLAILSGAFYSYDEQYRVPDDKSAKGNTGWYYTRTSEDGMVVSVDYSGNLSYDEVFNREGSVRPLLKLPTSFSQIISDNKIGEYNGCSIISLFEYPQYVPDDIELQEKLESRLKNGELLKTGRTFTFNKNKYGDDEKSFVPSANEEYELEGKRYIRVLAKFSRYDGIAGLSDENVYFDEHYVWLEVSPLEWLLQKNDTNGIELVSKKGILSGIRFDAPDIKEGKNHSIRLVSSYIGGIKTTEMYKFLNNYMLKDLLQTLSLSKENNYEEEELKGTRLR